MGVLALLAPWREAPGTGRTCEYMGVLSWEEETISTMVAAGEKKWWSPQERWWLWEEMMWRQKSRAIDSDYRWLDINDQALASTFQHSKAEC